MKNSIPLLFLFVILLISCTNQNTPETTNAHLKHIVICWLKDPGNPEHRQKLIDASDILNEIPGVINVSVGEVIESERSIVDDSFDVAYVFTFSDSTSMNSYLAHPDHKKLLKNLINPLVDKILIYDYLDDTNPKSK